MEKYSNEQAKDVDEVAMPVKEVSSESVRMSISKVT